MQRRMYFSSSILCITLKLPLFLQPSVAEVISVGPGGMVDGHDVVMTVKPGDKVITSKYAGTEVKLDDEEYVVVRQSDILAIVE